MATRLQVEHRRVLITGATGGVGRAIARELHGRGADLVLTGRRAGVLDELAAELGATALTADLSSLEAVDALVAQAGSVDVLVANAALPSTGDLLDFSTDELERALTVNLSANARLARLLAEPMVARGEGHLVFVGSVAGKAALAGSAVYSATKFGLRGMALALRADLKGSGVGVSLVEPGLVRDAGMFADTGIPVPRGLRTVTSVRVADALVRAIERNRGEVLVAPLELRVLVNLASLFPNAMNSLLGTGSMGGLADAVVDAQRHSR